MALRKSEEPLTKVTLNLFARDVERLNELYTRRYTTYIRHLVRAHLTRSDAALAATGAKLASEIDLDLGDEIGLEDE